LFQITVPLATKEELLGPAEQLLAMMRWVAQGKAARLLLDAGA
jgi:hypothetical protein